MAGHGMIGIEREERGIDAVADAGDAVGTARMKPATGWERRRRPHVADRRRVERPGSKRGTDARSARE